MSIYHLFLFVWLEVRETIDRCFDKDNSAISSSPNRYYGANKLPFIRNFILYHLLKHLPPVMQKNITTNQKVASEYQRRSSNSHSIIVTIVTTQSRNSSKNDSRKLYTNQCWRSINVCNCNMKGTLIPPY